MFTECGLADLINIVASILIRQLINFSDSRVKPSILM